jgi:hypothetical protein
MHLPPFPPRFQVESVTIPTRRTSFIHQAGRQIPYQT